MESMLDPEFLLSQGASYKKIPRGNYVFNEGEECHYYYQLSEGRIRWVNTNEQGKEFIQSIIEPGQCFGELPLFDDLPYAASALADIDSTVIRLPKNTFLEKIKENPELCFAFTRLLAGRLRFKFMLLKELACYTPEHQVMTLMNYFRSVEEHPYHGRYRVNLTRQQIADMSGLRVETVIRAIKKLEQAGDVIIEKGKVYC